MSVSNDHPQLLTKQFHGPRNTLVNVQPDVMNENEGDPISCLSRTNLIGVNGIFYDRCHFECETLTAEDARKHNTSEDPYYCISCIYEGQCDNSDDLSLFPGERNTQENDPPLLNENREVEISDVTGTCTCSAIEKPVFVSGKISIRTAMPGVLNILPCNTCPSTPNYALTCA